MLFLKKKYNKPDKKEFVNAINSGKDANRNMIEVIADFFSENLFN